MAPATEVVAKVDPWTAGNLDVHASNTGRTLEDEVSAWLTFGAAAAAFASCAVAEPNESLTADEIVEATEFCRGAMAAALQRALPDHMDPLAALSANPNRMN